MCSWRPQVCCGPRQAKFPPKVCSCVHDTWEDAEDNPAILGPTSGPRQNGSFNCSTAVCGRYPHLIKLLVRHRDPRMSRSNIRVRRGRAHPYLEDPSRGRAAIVSMVPAAGISDIDGITPLSVTVEEGHEDHRSQCLAVTQYDKLDPNIRDQMGMKPQL
jgi:hypothetical protein